MRMEKTPSRYLQRRVQNSLLYLILTLGFISFAVALYKGGLHLVELRPDEVTLSELPSAMTLSLFRMSLSYVASLIFALILGLLAARSRWGERLIIPSLDILQSVPVVGFFPAAISFFISISNGNRIGVELAAVFLIFTSQAWNMAFAVYEAVKGLPDEQLDAVMSFGLKARDRFFRLYLPASIPRLVYNSILSWSNGWFFLVACEIIAVGPLRYHLPGIGSFLALAAEQDALTLVLWGLFALTFTVLLMDFFIWRPVSRWAERFRQDQISVEEEEEDLGELGLHPATLMSRLEFVTEPLKTVIRVFFSPVFWFFREVALPLLWDLPIAIVVAVWSEIYFRIVEPLGKKWHRFQLRFPRFSGGILIGIGLGIIGWLGYQIALWLSPPWPSITKEIPLAVLASTGRLVIALVLSLVWILPLVLWVWNRPKARRRLTTIAQVGASLPATALFPLLFLVVVRKLGGGMEFATILLLMSGMQWYLLFNSLGGTATIPADLKEATRSFGLSRFQTWKRLVLPAIRPALVTGALTAWGGGWNALVVAEYVTHKESVLTVMGIGALLNESVYQLGDHRAITLCIAAMVGWILLMNTVFWKPVYKYSIDRFKLEG